MSYNIVSSLGTSPKKCGMSIRPVTPRKGHTVPPSPAKATAGPLRAMQGLPCSIGTKPCVQGAQSTIVRWLGNSPATVQRKQKTGATPRKLIITPKKCVEAGIKAPGSDRGHVRGVKRKLDCGDSSAIGDGPPTSKLRTESQDENSKSPKSFKLSPNKTGSTPLRALNEQDLNTDSPRGKETRKLLFDIEGPLDKTPVKRSGIESSPCGFQSPTANLPNYVMDPKPRAPQAAPTTPRTPDWLTQMKRNRQEAGSPRSRPHSPAPVEGATPKLRTPVSTNKKPSQQSTPKTPTVSCKLFHSCACTFNWYFYLYIDTCMNFLSPFRQPLE